MSTMHWMAPYRAQPGEHKGRWPGPCCGLRVASLPALLSGLLIAAALNHGFLVGDTTGVGLACLGALSRCLACGVRHVPPLSLVRRRRRGRPGQPRHHGGHRGIASGTEFSSSAAATCPAASNKLKWSAIFWPHCRGA